MRKLTLLTLATTFFGVNVCSAVSLNDGDFETLEAWSGSTSVVTVNAASASKWWFGDEPLGWIRQGDPKYAPVNQFCAGVVDGYGRSGGLVQFVPVTDETSFTLSFRYLLWFGDMEPTTVDYAVVGWHADDVIDLSTNGLDATPKILSGALSSPEYYGQGDPAPYFTLFSASHSIDATEYDYIGVWFRYTIDGGSFYVDDVKMNLTPVPEPATLGLLGLGGMAFLLRNRR